MNTEKKAIERCEHLWGIHDVRMCSKLGYECPSPRKCIEDHGDLHYKPQQWTNEDSWNFWGF